MKYCKNVIHLTFFLDILSNILSRFTPHKIFSYPTFHSTHTGFADTPGMYVNVFANSKACLCVPRRTEWLII